MSAPVGSTVTARLDALFVGSEAADQTHRDRDVRRLPIRHAPDTSEDLNITLTCSLPTSPSGKGSSLSVS